MCNKKEAIIDAVIDLTSYSNWSCDEDGYCVVCDAQDIFNEMSPYEHTASCRAVALNKTLKEQ